MRHARFLTFVVLVSSYLVSACDPYDTKYKNARAKIHSLEDPKAKIPRNIWGNVQVMDGCRFQIANFTIVPPGQGVYWYAIPTKVPTDEEPPLLARVVQQGLGAYNGQTVVFHLTPDYNFDDLAILLIYSEGDKRSYGAFGVNGKVKDYMEIPSATNGVDLQLDPTQYLNDGVSFTRPSTIAFMILLAFLVIVVNHNT